MKSMFPQLKRVDSNQLNGFAHNDFSNKRPTELPQTSHGNETYAKKSAPNNIVKQSSLKDSLRSIRTLEQ